MSHNPHGKRVDAATQHLIYALEEGLAMDERDMYLGPRALALVRRTLPSTPLRAGCPPPLKLIVGLGILLLLRSHLRS